MRLATFKIFIFFLCLSSLNVFAAEIRESSTGKTFPSEVTFQFEGKVYRVQATGTSVRKKFFVKVYSIASYLQDPPASKEKILDEILQDVKAKQLTMKWVHDASANQVQEGYQDSFKKVLSESEYAQLEGAIDHFVHLFSKDVKDGDEHVLRWIPEGNIDVLINGEQAGTLKSPEFAKALWSIWFGSHSVVNRDNLVSLKS